MVYAAKRCFNLSSGFSTSMVVSQIPLAEKSKKKAQLVPPESEAVPSRVTLSSSSAMMFGPASTVGGLLMRGTGAASGFGAGNGSTGAGAGSGSLALGAVSGGNGGGGRA